MEASITIRRGRDTYVSNINIADDAEASRVLASELAEIQKQFLKKSEGSPTGRADRRPQSPTATLPTGGETK